MGLVRFSFYCVTANVTLVLTTSLAGAADPSPTALEVQARDLVSQLTLEEKVGLIVGDGRFVPGFEAKTQDAGAEMIVEDQLSQVVIPRLGIRTTPMSDGPAGLNRQPRQEGAVAYEYTTAFPTGTCLAASWNLPLVNEVGMALGNEVLEYGYDLILAPGLNIHRNPRDGRVFEYYSEDPYLSGKMAASMVLGVQANGVGATLKHFLAHNQQTNRRTYNAVISERALREIYLRGFEIAVNESRPACIMTSYNRMNGLYTAENPDLIEGIVRQEWGFDGFFITDFDGLGSSAAKVRGGSNLLMSGNQAEVDELKAALREGSLDERMLDDRLVPYLKFKLNTARARGHVPSHKPNLEAHAATARVAAGEGMVLLKNEARTLPLKAGTTLAVFGKTSYDLIPFGTGSGVVRSAAHAVSVNAGLKAAGFRVLPDLEAEYTAYIEQIKRENRVPEYFDNPKMREDNGIQGDQAPPHFQGRLVAFSKEKALSREAAAAWVAQADGAVITLGRSAGENYENGYLPISNIELDLLRDVAAACHDSGKKLTVVLNVGGVWETASWRDLADAILVAWMPGQEGGHAVADLVSGAVNPSGKLPDSFPLRYEDVPSSGSFPGTPAADPVNSIYDEDIYVGYRHYDTAEAAVAWPFGFGLSYTQFAYSDLKLGSESFEGEMAVSVAVMNTGDMPGKEVVQLYLAAPRDGMEKPVHELKGFAKTKLLAPGEAQRVDFRLDLRALASFSSEQRAWVADEGDYEVQIGASSRDIRLRATFELAHPIKSGLRPAG